MGTSRRLPAGSRAGFYIGPMIFFLLQRPDGDYLFPADYIDSAYGKALRKALDSGVEVLAYRSVLSAG
ncbi:MAG: DNA/RNA nuclease SfsA, partial [Gemmatimonadota bacterium]|nr:DNA/RNA nuclease SfsA [Gemmatimonadota bacterium]